MSWGMCSLPNQQSKLFPKGVNVGFIQILNRNTFKLRVYERGAGETLACGTGACAAVAVGRMHGELDEDGIDNLVDQKDSKRTKEAIRQSVKLFVDYVTA